MDDLTLYPFDGKIEFLRIFRRALTAEEHMIAHLGGRLAEERELADVRELASARALAPAR